MIMAQKTTTPIQTDDKKEETHLMGEVFSEQTQNNMFLSHKLVSRPRNKSRIVFTGDKLLPNCSRFANTIEAPNTHEWP